MNARIIVGVSGGLDSSLAALRLLQNGWNVTAVHLDMLGTKNAEDSARLDLLEKHFHITVIRIDCRQRFEKCVVAPFITAYKRGETPNPCVICNEAVKIRVLFEQADRIGATKVATGHYARTVSYHGKTAIARSPSRKDQTYVLHRLPHEWLDRMFFPLEDMSDKAAVRDELASFSFTDVYTANESQDICFLAGENLETFLKRRISDDECFVGRMKDEQGHDLGAHKGLIFYTEGQRKGLGLSCGPWFVERRDFTDGILHLSHGRERLRKRIYYDRAVWQQSIADVRELRVQYCYRFPPVRVALLNSEENETSGIVLLDFPAGGVSLGQSLVFYDDDILLGGGVIIGTE